MQRILIIGSGGAGKSTLARQLGAQLHLPVVHLDRLFWYGNWQHLDKATFDARLAEELAKPTWIMDGNFKRTLPVRLARCDTVLFLDYPTITCLWGALRRITHYYGRVRPDMGGECAERFDPEFLRWILHYRKNARPKMVSALAAAGPGVTVYTFKNRRETKRFFDNMA